jgi:aminopeptidase N
LTINGIFLNGISQDEFNFEYDEHTITLNPQNANIKAGEEFEITIYYTYSSGKRLGFYFYRETFNGRRKIAFTKSEPDLTRYWLPSNDCPSDRASNSFRITVPASYTAGANGALDSTTTKTMGGGKPDAVTYYWSDDVEIPTYLMVMVASEYVLDIGHWVRDANLGDSIPVYIITTGRLMKKKLNPPTRIQIKFLMFILRFLENTHLRNTGLHRANRSRQAAWKTTHW